MWKTEEDLKSDLEDAFAPVTAEEEFLTSLREGLTRGSGGEHEVSIPIDRRRLLFAGAGLAAAAGLLVIFLLVPRSAPEVVPAADGLPEAKTGVVPTGNLPIDVAKDGSITIDGEKTKTPGVIERIGEVVKRKRAGEAKKLVATISAKGTTKWQAVHDVLKGLAKVEVPAELAVTDAKSGERRALPVPLPDDPAITGRSGKRPVRLVLSRGVDEERTVLEMDGLEIGHDGAGLDQLAEVLERRRGESLGPARIEAFAAVPLARVVRLIDILRAAGTPVQGLSRDAPAYLTVDVYLYQKGEDTTVRLPWLRKTVGLEEALKALEARIRELQGRGRKVHGFVDSAIYIDRQAVERILAVYHEAGIRRVMMIH